MSDNINITEGSGKVLLGDEVTHATFGLGTMQAIKIYDATVNGTNPLAIGSNGAYIEIRASNMASLGGSNALNSQADGHSATLGITSGSASVTDSAGTIQNYMRGLTKWAYERMPAARGQSVMTAAFPVVIASDQSAVKMQGAAAANVAATTGNPVLIGAVGRNTEQTPVSSGSTAIIASDVFGRLIVSPYQQYDNAIYGYTADMTDTSNYTVISARGTGIRSYITSLIVTNSHATTGTWVNIKDGSTTIHTGYAAALGGGFTITFPFPLRGSTNTAVVATCETSGANVRVSVAGFSGA